VAVGMPVTRHRRVEGVVTQRPPPPIVAGGFPARRSSEPGSHLSISRKTCIGDRKLRLYQGKALVALLALLPASFAVLPAPTYGLPPALLGESGATQETLAMSRYAVRVIVAAPGLIEGVRLCVQRRMAPVADELLESLCRSLEALALGPAFPCAMA